MKRRRWRRRLKRWSERLGEGEVENTVKKERERLFISCDFQTLFANKSKVDFMFPLIDVCVSLS